MCPGENVITGTPWLDAEHVTVDVCKLQMHELQSTAGEKAAVSLYVSNSNYYFPCQFLEKRVDQLTS